MVPVSTLKTTPLAMEQIFFAVGRYRRRKIVIDFWPRAILTASSVQTSRTQLSLISAAEMDLIIGRLSFVLADRWSRNCHNGD